MHLLVIPKLNNLSSGFERIDASDNEKFETFTIANINVLFPFYKYYNYLYMYWDICMYNLFFYSN